MKLNRWVVAGTAAAFVMLPAAAIADPPGAVRAQDFADASEDAPPSVDIINVHVYRPSADGEYRATVKFTGLRAQDGNRYYVAFEDAGASRQAGIPATPNGNLVEFRRTPGGQEKTLSFRTTNGTNATLASCGGVRATPDYAKSKISFVIPTACWKSTSGAARVTAGSRHYAPGTFSTADNPPETGGSDMKSDLLDESGTWIYAGLA